MLLFVSAEAYEEKLQYEIKFDGLEHSEQISAAPCLSQSFVITGS